MNAWVENILFASRDAAVLSVVIGVVVLICGKHIPAGWRHGLWLLVALRLAMPVLPTSPVSWQRVLEKEGVEMNGKAPVSIPKTEVPATVAVEDFGFRMPDHPTESPADVRLDVSEEKRVDAGKIMFLFWSAGAVSLLAVGTVCSFGFWRRLRKFSGNDAEQEKLEGFLAGLGEELGWKVVPRVRVTGAVEVPALFGVFRPEVLIPPSALERLSEAELRLVLMHELGHWRRRDLWVNLLLAVLQAVHWFNPLVWWAFHRTRVESERATDAWVLRRAGADEAGNYGRMLLRLLERGANPRAVFSGMVGVVESPKDLKRRMLGIVSFSGKRNRWAVLASVVVLVGVATVCLTKPPEDVAESAVAISEAESDAFICRVVSPEGIPVEGAEVYSHVWSQIDGSDFDPFALVGKTDEAGICRVPFKPEWLENSNVTYSFFARHGTEGFGATGTARPEADSLKEIKLEKDLGLSFRVSNGKGKPIEGLRLKVKSAKISKEIRHGKEGDDPKFWGAVPALPEGFWNSVTDEDGRCRIEGLPHGSYYIDHGDGRYAQIPGPMDHSMHYQPQAQGSVLELNLKPAASVSGTVRLPNGTAVGGARVRIMEKFRYVQGGVSSEAWTDRDGRYELGRLAAADYHLVVDLPETPDIDWVSNIEELTLKAGEKRADFIPRFSEGGLISGKVVLDDTGEGARDVMVAINSSRRDTPFGSSALITDNEGRFRMRVRAGEVKAYVAGSLPEGYIRGTSEGKVAEVDLKIEDGGSYPVELILEPENQISGIVVDEAGKPAPGVEVRCIEPPGNPSGVMSDEQGKFSLILPTGVKKAHLVARSGNFLSPLDGWYPTGEKVELRLREVSLKTITGKVVNEGGEPINDSVIALESSLPRQYLYRTWMPKDTRSDESGLFEFIDVLPADNYTVTVSKPGYGGKRATAVSTPGKELTFEPIALPVAVATISGRVVDSSGSGVEGVGIKRSQILPQPIWSDGKTDAKGRFRVGGLVEGWHDLRFVKGTMDGQREAFVRVKSGSKDVEVVLPEGLSNWKTQDGPVTLVGELAPPLIARKWFHSDGLAEKHEGKVRLVTFVGMSQPLDRFKDTLDMLQKFRGENTGRELEVIVVHGDWPEEEVREILERDYPDFKLPLALEPEEGAMSEAFGVNLWLYVVVDRDGKVVFQSSREWEKAKEMVLELLGK